MPRSTFLAGATALAAALTLGYVWAGCGASAESRFTGTTAGGTGAGGAMGTGAGNNSSGSSLGGFNAGTGGACTTQHCSSDLHSLVDCDGNVVMTCPANEGCTLNGCVPACASAIANKTSVGCEYYAVVPDVSFDGAGACFAAFVANTWTTPVTLTVDYGGMPLDPSTFAFIPSGSGQNVKYTAITNGQIPAGAVAILFLNSTTNLGGFPNKACPTGITAAVFGTDAEIHGTAIAKAFHFTASAPVVAYDMYPYGGGNTAITSATLLLPTSAWDTNYIAVDANGSGAPPFNAPFVQFVASEDNTTVTINPTAAIVAGTGVVAATQGVPQAYMLSHGDVLQITQLDSLGGSVVQSDKPIGAWGGQQSFSVVACCDDTGHQQIPPIRALGSEYTLVKYRDRYDNTPEAPPWRLIGAVKGTVLSWEPTIPAGAPTSLGLGQIVKFDGPGPYVVRSQDADHPFYVSAQMTGGALYDPSTADPNANPDGRGDAEFVNVVPPGEFLDNYVFFTDPTYPETDLVLLRVKGPRGFSDVTLDCIGTVPGWTALGISGKYEYTRVDLVRHDFAPQGKCNNGRHEIQSKGAFGVTVWGWGSAETGGSDGPIPLPGFYTQYVSYAYPAGAGFAPINQVVVPPSTQ
jgi:hypothetical protein